ncbi:multiple inositol polyphosphate phosphatase 1-like [Anoplopoma fimbria]|uniref:multiple inositol polyphosphate phosphatase 1-like n=1 Tax=Anoplopoma fimbria TaxID=229290 RepID=UPI0023EC580C|nr:multiple inositol polyphosphate phosphatase 1-like [Anoplopoma fimbria]
MSPCSRTVFALLLTRMCCSSAGPRIPHIAAYFGTKTRYEDAHPRLLRDALRADGSALRPPAAARCSPLHLTALLRHGSRYPTAPLVRRMRQLSELVRREGGHRGGGCRTRAAGTCGTQRTWTEVLLGLVDPLPFNST